MLDLLSKLYNGEFRERIKNSIRPFTYHQNLGEDNYLGYGMHGTGFFLIYGDEHLFITARHNFERSNTIDKYNSVKVVIDSFLIIKKLDLMIDLKHKGSRMCIDNIYFHSIHFDEFDSDKGIGGFNSYDVNDIATVSLCSELPANVLKMPYNSTVSSSPNHKDDTKISKKGDKIWIIGHPADTNHTHYDVKKESASMSFSRNHLVGLFEDKIDGIVKVEIKHDGNLNNYSGLSGSPVFLIDDDSEYLSAKLTGMVIKGSANSKIIHFVSIEHIYIYLFQLDLHTAMFGRKVEANNIKKLIEEIDNMNIGSVEYKSNKIHISLENGEELAINPCHHYILISLHILATNKKVIDGESIYLIQELVIAARENSDLLSYLSEKSITKDVLEEIKCILKDRDIRTDMVNVLGSKLIQKRLSEL